ncbi:MAG: hypothetical protein JO168_11790 [Solirubrobacterales bacterium]|nr:hypothetical protein [Solirubrobacterales bacterium]
MAAAAGPGPLSAGAAGLAAEDALRRLDALLAVGLGLARSARTGRVALARAAAAIDPDWLPGRSGRRLAAELRAASERPLEPLPPRRIERILRDAWGTSPTEELDELDGDPVALTPGSQVHVGRRGGHPVAIKVLRPGLAAALRQDLALLEALAAPLATAFPGLDAGAVLREVRERTLAELDLESEAEAQRRFHRALRGHPFLVVAPPVMALCRSDVLVSEWVDGAPLWHARDPDQAAARLVRFALGAPATGMIHADLNPDDVLVLADGRLAILDFGATREVDRARVALAAEALEAFIARDAEALGDRLERLGWLPRARAGEALALSTTLLAELGGPEPARLDSAAVLAARDRVAAHDEALAELAACGRLEPEDLWPARGIGQLFGTIALVGATGAWPELARGALREGW